ncbi:unnamed protein product [Notodromas monacha]|uniref:UDENN domain-containing protein n=1 Tax=Notodromas monacha TaxID=399045 RepID=A0A7R9BPP0_9CRUS|nr:unnamed protein product [Notodromas monacha]CAG0918019.1 unnamed protein product [Notodromas monacha]
MKISALGSRLRSNPTNVFDCFCEVACPVADGIDGVVSKPWILQKFPENYNNQEVLKSMPDFVFPCDYEKVVVQHWSFVLTNVDSKWTFGFCRHSGGNAASDTALVILSCLPWHEPFFKILNEIASLLFSGRTAALMKFLQALYSSRLPEPGKQLSISLLDAANGSFSVACPDHFSLPKIPDNINLMEYVNAVDINCMIEIFSAMLRERRIIVVSKKLSRLSACVQAANSLIAPMNWQHIFIPLLPLKLIEYLSAPMPFLVGVPAPIFAKVRRNEIGEAVILNADDNRIESPFRDADGLPPEILSHLKKSLNNPTNLMGEGVSRAFLRALVALIGGYRDALRLKDGQKVLFDHDMFIKTRPPSTQPYLKEMLCSQIFQQFVDERVEIMNSGQGFSDEFELEAALHAVTSESKSVPSAVLKDWMGSVKKEGGHLLKTVRTKANPAVKTAVQTVKEKSKSVKTKSQSAVRDIRSKLGVERELSSPGQLQSESSSPTIRRRRKQGSLEIKRPVGSMHRRVLTDINIPASGESEIVRTSGNGDLNHAKSDLLVFFNDELDAVGTPSLSSSSSSVDLEPPKHEDFDLLEDLKQAFDARLSATTNFESDKLSRGRSVGDLLCDVPPEPPERPSPLGHPNPLYALHYPEASDQPPLPPVPARKKLSFESGPSTFKPASNAAEPAATPLLPFGSSSSSLSGLTAAFPSLSISPNGPSAASGPPVLPPPLVPLPTAANTALNTVSSRKAFFDSLLEESSCQSPAPKASDYSETENVRKQLPSTEAAFVMVDVSERSFEAMLGSAWRKVLQKTRRAVVYMDGVMAECLQWNGGVSQLFGAGALAVHCFSKDAPTVVGAKKAVFVLRGPLAGPSRDTLRVIISNHRYDYCVVITAASAGIHRFLKNKSSPANPNQIDGKQAQLNADILEEMEIGILQWTGNPNSTVEIRPHPLAAHIQLMEDVILLPTCVGLDLMGESSPVLFRHFAFSLAYFCSTICSSRPEVFYTPGSNSEKLSRDFIAAAFEDGLWPSRVDKRLNQSDKHAAHVILVDRAADLTSVSGHWTGSVAESVFSSKFFPHLPGHSSDLTIMIPIIAEKQTTRTEVFPGCLSDILAEQPGLLSSAFMDPKDRCLKKFFSKCDAVLPNDDDEFHDASEHENLSENRSEVLRDYTSRFYEAVGKVKEAASFMQMCLLAKAAIDEEAKRNYLASAERNLVHLWMKHDPDGDLLDLIIPEVERWIRCRHDEDLTLDDVLGLLVFCASLFGESVLRLFDSMDTDDDDNRENSSRGSSPTGGPEIELSLIDALWEDQENLPKICAKIVGQEIDEVSVRMAGRKICEKLSWVASRRKKWSSQFHELVVQKDPYFPAEYSYLISELLKGVVSPAKPEITTLSHRPSEEEGLRDLLKSGLGFLMKSKKSRHPGDADTIIVAVLGGLSPYEIRTLRNEIGGRSDKRIIICGTRLLKPEDILEDLFI